MALEAPRTRTARRRRLWPAAFLLWLGASPGGAQSIRVQCPAPTAEHPSIKCAHIAAGDGFVTMADGVRQYMFGFSPLPVDGDELEPGTQPVDPGEMMMTGMLNASFPAPTITVDEDDELFLTLTNVGMMMRPDLFDPHSVHWHGFPQAAPIFDGVPDSSAVINMGASFTYYYKVMDAGTYMYHCHVEATEHMQMGMLGNLYVRPRQNRGTAPPGCLVLPALAVLGGAAPGPGVPLGYAYNDCDGSTRYDLEYPIQLGGFDPEFHNASESVQPLPFAGMRDRYFMLNGRGYPDTVNPAVLSTNDDADVPHPSQPMHSLIEAAPGQRILLRLSQLNVTHFDTIATLGIPMQVVALDARLLRDDGGNNLYYTTNSLTLGGGQSADVILDTTGLPVGSTYFLYTTNLHQLANDTQNFGGMMTEIRITAPPPPLRAGSRPDGAERASNFGERSR